MKNKRFNAGSEWNLEFANSGAFDHINRMTAFDEWRNWPSCDDLASLLPYEVENLNKKSITFVPQQDEQNFSAVAYEEVVFETGQVPTRKHSWHDLFGALTWSLFPKTKALINQLHVNDINQFGKKERSSLRNLLTLFDECGVVLVSTNQAALADLANHKWSEVFVNQRELWHQASESGIGVFPFGHANYEMMIKPFIGLTGKWVVLDMSAELLSLPLNVQYRLVDEKLTESINNGMLEAGVKLKPLPLLGIPGWTTDNEQPSYYLNEEYFRPLK